MKNFPWIKTDERTLEHQTWSNWLSRVRRTRDVLTKKIGEDPLRYNETASVSVLASAAQSGGMIAVAEYIARKRRASDLRKRFNGRCDLWLYNVSGDRSWTLEFKQWFCPSTPRIVTLRNKADAARQDADCVLSWQSDRRFGVLLVVPKDGRPFSAGGIANLSQLATEVDFACRLEGGLSPAFLFFLAAG